MIVMRLITIGFHAIILFLAQLQIDDAENVPVSTLPSFSSTSLPLSDVAIQYGDQPESQQLKNGKYSKNLMWLSVFYTTFHFIESCNDTVLDSFDLLSLPSNRYKEGIDTNYY